MKSIKEVWPIFLDKSRVAWENRIEVGGMTETVGDFCDAIEADPDGFVELVRMTDSEGIMFLMPFFEEIADLPDSIKWLIKIQEAIRDKGSDSDRAEIDKLIALKAGFTPRVCGNHHFTIASLHTPAKDR